MLGLVPAVDRDMPGLDGELCDGGVLWLRKAKGLIDEALRGDGRRIHCSIIRGLARNNRGGDRWLVADDAVLGRTCLPRPPEGSRIPSTLHTGCAAALHACYDGVGL